MIGTYSWAHARGADTTLLDFRNVVVMLVQASALTSALPVATASLCLTGRPPSLPWGLPSSNGRELAVSGR